MAAGRAKLLHAETGKRVAIGRPNQILWSELYENNPYLVAPNEVFLECDIVRLLDYPGHRPYIDYQGTRLHPDNRRSRKPNRWVFNYHHGPPEPAEIFLKMEECWQAAKYMDKAYVVLDPYAKSSAPPAKRWYSDHFQQVVDAISPYVEVIQPIYGRAVALDGVTPKTTSVREVAIWISNAKCVITNEGLLHHLAAAFNTPCVVIAGGFADKRISGYEYQTWVSREDKRVRGVRVSSRLGMELMASIMPKEVISPVKRILKEAGI